MGVRGTSGVRNGRARPGLVLRMIMMSAHTSTKANSVPVLVMLPTQEIGAKAENRLTNSMNTRFEHQGVR